MVKNESDIIEPFVRHNLAFVDHIHVLVHASADSTGQILGRMIDEGLALSVEREGDFVFDKQAIFNAAMQRAIDRYAPEFVVPLDADEFISASDKAVFAEELARIPAGGGILVPWVSYVPTEEDDSAQINPLLRIRHLRSGAGREHAKCFFRAEALAAGAELADGQHVLRRADGSSPPQIRSAGVTLAHFPVRSAAQFATKTMVGWLARRVSENFAAGASSPAWSNQNLPGAERRTPRELRAIAERYQIEKGSPEIKLVERPLSTQARELKYADLIDVDALARVFAQAEAMAGRLGQVSGVIKQSGLDRDHLNALIGERAQALVEVRRLQHELRRTQEKLSARNRVMIAAILITVAAVTVVALVALGVLS